MWMKIQNLKYIIFLLGVFVSFKATAQVYADDESKYFNPLTDDITKRLPNIRVLIDSAIANSPSVRYEELKADYYYYEQLSQERNWMEHFSFNLDWNWGVWNFHDTQTSTISNPNTFHIDLNSIRDNFAIGFYIRFPLATIVDRKNRIGKQKKWQELSFVQREINRQFVITQTIEAYDMMIQWQNYIRIYNDYQRFTEIQMQMAQNQFLNGEISTAEYTRLKEIQTRGAVEYQQAIAEFSKNYRTLEILTGINFNLINVLR
ncbi:hypothetical protein MASR2M12_03300 [Bacteroidales bacterium]